MQSQSSTIAPQIRAATSKEGWQWWVDAWSSFKVHAGIWIVIGIVALLSMLGDFVPTIGWIVSGALAVVFDAGVLSAANKQRNGAAPLISDVFAGFRQRTFPLLILGLTLAIAYHLALVIAVDLAGSGANILLSREWDGGGIDILSILIAAMILLVLVLPILMAAWFATALVLFDQQNAFAALKLSFVASCRNVPALTVFGLAQILFAIAATVPFALGWLVLNPLTLLAAYASYRAVFTQPTAGAAEFANVYAARR